MPCLPQQKERRKRDPKLALFGTDSLPLIRGGLGWGSAFRRLGLLAFLFLSATTSIRADIFLTNTGDKIEGELVEEKGDSYRIRTLSGVIDIEKDRVVKITKKTSPWKRYRDRVKNCPDTAEGHFKLAQWCEANGLRSERIDHLEKTVRLDPNHTAARQALGYIRDDKGQWTRKKSKNAPSDADQAALRQQQEEEKLIRKIVAQWFVKIKAIQRGRLSVPEGPKRAEKFREGRDKILAIGDPLAIPALTGVLSAGDGDTRMLLVEALTQFEDDEAMMNLVVVALLDPAAVVCKEAALALLKKKDDRVVLRLRQALGSDEERMVRHAATALGLLKAQSAVENLIDVLSIETQQLVRISRPVYLDGLTYTFGGYTRVPFRGRFVAYHPSGIGCLGPGTMLGTETDYELQTVSIQRTEVQEALMAITGQNFGFDRAAWRQWWLQHAPTTQPTQPPRS